MALGGLSLRTSRLHLASFKYSCEKMRFFMVSGYIMQAPAHVFDSPACSLRPGCVPE